MNSIIDRLGWILKKLRANNNTHTIINELELEAIDSYETWIEISDELIRQGLPYEAIESLNKAELMLDSDSTQPSKSELRDFYESKADTAIDIANSDETQRTFFLEIALSTLLKIIKRFPNDDNENVWKGIADVRANLGQPRTVVLDSLLNAFSMSGELKGANKVSKRLEDIIRSEEDVITLAELGDNQLIYHDDSVSALRIYARALQMSKGDSYKKVMTQLIHNLILHATGDLGCEMSELVK